MDKDNLETLLKVFLEASPEEKRLTLDLMTLDVLEALDAELGALSTKTQAASTNTSMELLKRRLKVNPNLFAEFMDYIGGNGDE